MSSRPRGLCLWMFTLVAAPTNSPALGLIAAIAVGALVGLVNGLLIARLKLSSLVVTLGMNFLLRGLIMTGTNGEGSSLTYVKDTWFYTAFVGKINGFPVQMLWGLAFLILCQILFTRSRFGAHVCFVGDNPVSARETGVQVERVKIYAYLWWAGVGVCVRDFGPDQQHLLAHTRRVPAQHLAAVFIRRHATWGGVGTIIAARWARSS